ncbi:hypothetical protein Cal7507_0878 [Calothrix sp. PCC 7507]|nr:hypothetical protein Cal7507_0878 [Calothrix sp. PCC 7507]
MYRIKQILGSMYRTQYFLNLIENIKTGLRWWYYVGGGIGKRYKLGY